MQPSGRWSRVWVLTALCVACSDKGQAQSHSGGQSAGGTGAPAIGGTGTGGTSTGGTSSGGTSSGSAGASTLGGAPTGGAGTGTPSSGCSLTSLTTGATIDGTIAVGTLERTYRLSVPADAAPGEPLPLVFALNGVGGDGKGAQAAFRLETNHRAIFVYPDSIYNDTVSTVAWFFEENGVDVAFFDALVADLNQRYCVDTSRIFALGVSSGAIMANMLGCFRGDVLRAIAPASGMTWQNRCTGDVAVMVICGQQDPYNPCDDAQNGALSETNFWAPENGCGTAEAPSSIATLCSEFQGCAAADPVLRCEHAGGHTWPTSDGDFWWRFFMGLH